MTSCILHVTPATRLESFKEILTQNAHKSHKHIHAVRYWLMSSAAQQLLSLKFQTVGYRYSAYKLLANGVNTFPARVRKRFMEQNLIAPNFLPISARACSSQLNQLTAG